ncbi:hypothetical protein VNO80_26762 [Phaseolus coccineus]|uniref:Uncharacterized protein n=1 Tax=Phaseolus coccineus TaxID=3886 RepID=A0AAN9LJ36_PHACN
MRSVEPNWKKFLSVQRKLQLRKGEIRTAIRTRGGGDRTHLSLRQERGWSERAVPLARSWIWSLGEGVEEDFVELDWGKKSVKDSATTLEIFPFLCRKLSISLLQARHLSASQSLLPPIFIFSV